MFCFCALQMLDDKKCRCNLRLVVGHSKLDLESPANEKIRSTNGKTPNQVRGDR